MPQDRSRCNELLVSAAGDGTVGVLVALQYRDRVELPLTRLQQLRQGADVRAGALRYFLGEREEELQNLVASREIPIYFENQALGMSMEYGLRASLSAIEDLFDRLREEKQLAGERIYARIVLVDAAGAVLIQSGEAALVDPAKSLAEFLEPAEGTAFFSDRDPRGAHLVFPDDVQEIVPPSSPRRRG